MEGWEGPMTAKRAGEIADREVSHVYHCAKHGTRCGIYQIASQRTPEGLSIWLRLDPLSAAEKRTIKALLEFIEEYGVAPGDTALARELDEHPGAVRARMKGLEGKGHVFSKYRAWHLLRNELGQEVMPVVRWEVAS